jgi:hypothetical protein
MDFFEGHHPIDDHSHGFSDVFTGSLCTLYVDIKALIAATVVEDFAEFEQGGGFAALAGGMEDKVFLLFDKGQNLFQIDSLRDWNKIVILFLDRSSGVEKFGHG